MSEHAGEGWEKIHTDKQRTTIRLRVPGGWIYLVVPKEAAGGAVNPGVPTGVFVPASPEQA